MSPGQAAYSLLLHWRRAAHWRGITWEYFTSLDPDEQAAYIAEYETVTRLEALESEAARRAHTRQRRQLAAGRRGRG